MVKSLGDYNKEKSSSSNVKNIKWTLKNPTNNEKPKNKIRKKISSTNIIYTENKKIEKTVEKVFKVEENTESEKPKNKISGKKFQKSSASNCKIERGFRRPAR
jgi:hypothetical protein